MKTKFWAKAIVGDLIKLCSTYYFYEQNIRLQKETGKLRSDKQAEND